MGKIKLMATKPPTSHELSTVVSCTQRSWPIDKGSMGSSCCLIISPMTPPSTTLFCKNRGFWPLPRLLQQVVQPDSHRHFANAARFQQHKQLDPNCNQPADTVKLPGSCLACYFFAAGILCKTPTNMVLIFVPPGKLKEPWSWMWLWTRTWKLGIDTENSNSSKRKHDDDPKEFGQPTLKQDMTKPYSKLRNHLSGRLVSCQILKVKCLPDFRWETASSTTFQSKLWDDPGYPRERTWNLWAKYDDAQIMLKPQRPNILDTKSRP